jgi:hypothetical protein
MWVIFLNEIVVEIEMWASKVKIRLHPIKLIKIKGL